MADPNLERIERNVRKMIDLRAPETDIDAYLGSEGYTPDKFRSAMLERKDTRGPLRRAADWLGGTTSQLRQGALLGLSDEIGAGIDATMQTVLPKARFADSGEPLWAKGNTWSERYDDALTRERGKLAKFREENPVTSTAAAVVGGMGGAPAQLVQPVAALTASLARPVQYAAAGAVPGALFGFGESEGGLGSRLQGAGVGAGVGAGMGVAAGYAGDALTVALRRVMGSSAQTPILNAQGQLTPEARQALQQAGIDPDTISQGFQQQFVRLAQDAARRGRPVDQAQLARALQGETLPVPVPQTRGQVSGVPSEQMFENLAAKGVYGPRTERFMQNVQQGQQEALQGNVDALARALSGGQPVRPEGQIPGRMAQDRLAAMRRQEAAPVRAAFQAARQTQAGVPADVVANMRGQIADQIGAAHNLANIPKVANVLRPLEDIGSGANASVPVSRLFQIREQLNGVIRGGGEDAIAANLAKRVLDTQLDDIISRNLIQGDQASIQAWRDAIGTYRDFAGRFRGDDIISKLTATDWRSGTRQLVVPPDQATNAIFNAKTLFGGGNTVRDLARLRDVLGANSPEWQGLRQEAVMRLFQQGRGPVNPTTGERTFSGANFSKAFDNAMREAPDLMRTFFTPDEIATLQQFRAVANRVTGVVKGGDNTSNTTVAAANVVQRLLGTIFTNENAVMRFMAVPLVRSVMDYGAGASMAGRTAAQAARVQLPSQSQRWAAPAGAVIFPPPNQGQ
jgi:hypothetical protein